MNPRKCLNHDYEQMKKEDIERVGVNGYKQNKPKLNPKPVNL